MSNIFLDFLKNRFKRIFIMPAFKSNHCTNIAVVKYIRKLTDNSYSLA